MSKRVSPQEVEEARERLRSWLKPGDTVYTVIRHVSRSGMQRVVDLFYVDEKRGICWIGGLAATAMRQRWDDKHRGLVYGGCGYSIPFQAVYDLGLTLWPDGFGCIGKGCHSNEHFNGDRDYRPHLDPLKSTERCNSCLAGDPCLHGRKYQHWHRSGGYALRQREL